MHQVVVQNELGKEMWKGQIDNSREGFNRLLDKLRLIEGSNNQAVSAIFMNPTGNYHLPIKTFLEAYYKVILVDARISEHLRISENLGREKSDIADASILASTAIRKPEILDSQNHERSPLSGLTRLMDSIKCNVTRITNLIKSDLAAVFPEYPFYEDIDSKTSLEILRRYATPESIVAAPLDEIVELLRKASKGHFGVKEAQKLKDSALKSIGAPDRERVYALMIKINVDRLTDEKGHLADIEEEVKKRSRDNEQVKNISNIKGISTLSEASIISEIGSIKQFDSALKLQAYGGKSPNIKGSGGKAVATGVS